MYQSLQRRGLNRGMNESEKCSVDKKPASRMRLRNIIAYYGGGGETEADKDQYKKEEGAATSRNLITTHTRNNTLISPSTVLINDQRDVPAINP